MSLGEPGVKRALDWILEQLRDDPSARRADLVDRAAREFDLTPLQTDFLYRQLREAAPGRGPAPGEQPRPHGAAGR